MKEDEVYQHLTKMTEEMYQSILKVQSSDYQDQLVTYHKNIEKGIEAVVKIYDFEGTGKLIKESRKEAQILLDDFRDMKKDIDSKYKIYIRGAGNSGKSTLLNALLSLDESVGSKTGKVPLTFTIDLFSDELEQNEAEIRKIGEDGKTEPLKRSREEALEIEEDERTRFEASKRECELIINEKIKSTSFVEVQEQIRHDVYRGKLLKTTIREIKWGIGRNDFFHNCMLIDTPGLNQELRFTNTLEDVKNYEVDGFLWVITVPNLNNAKVRQAYENELKEMAEIYKNKKSIAVINMMNTGYEEVLKYGSDEWTKIEKRAKKLCDKNFEFSDVVCVNAKLAYEGYINDNIVDTKSSNISELRKKVNEMFVEKSSKEIHETKLEKIDFLFDKFFEEIQIQNWKLEKILKEYDDKYAETYSKENTNKNYVKDKIATTIEDHLIGVGARTFAYRTEIKRLHTESDAQQDYFIKTEIIKVDKLQENIETALNHCLDHIFDEFKILQTKCIISGFKTEEYKISNFLKQGGSSKYIDSKLEFNYSTSTMSTFSGSFFGRSSTVSKLINGFFNFFNDPVKNLYEEIEGNLKAWSKQINLDDVIYEYVEQCRDTLSKSMSQTCGEYLTVKDIYERIDENIFYVKDNPEEFNLNERGLKELLYKTR